MRHYVATFSLLLWTVLAVAVVLARPAQAQTYHVIYNFTGGADGSGPDAGLAMDRGGNFYGTTGYGGYMGGDCQAGCGTVFRLAPKASGWIFTPLYAFQGGDDGHYATAGVVIGSNGSLYGTTLYGGGGDICPQHQGYPGCGTAFSLSLPPTVCKTAVCPWTETVLHRFSGGSDGGFPNYFGSLVFDRAGNLYGTTSTGGSNILGCYPEFGGCGIVFELTPAGGEWSEVVIYNFTNPQGAAIPESGVIRDQAGNLYGTTLEGAYNWGTVFELSPSGSGWTLNALYSFPASGNDGELPYGGLALDPSGNLFGSTSQAGPDNGGTAYELIRSPDSWTFVQIYAFSRSGFPEPSGPYASLTMDAAGNLYGTTWSDGAYGRGSIFKLAPSNGGWTYASLHDFTGGLDGAGSFGSVTLDANGNLYGTAGGGGAYGYGVVWEITP